MSRSPSHVSITFTIVLLLAFALPAVAVNYTNNCSGPNPSAAGTWFGTCGASENNWEDNILPGPGHSAVLGAEYGPVVINGYDSEATVMSVQAMGGLTTSVAGNGLILTSGGSVINGLVLAPGRITAQAGVTVSLLGTSFLSGDVTGPGAYENSGTVTLNSTKLKSGAVFANQNAATLTSGSIHFDAGTVLLNAGSLEVSGTAIDLRGGDSLLANNGTWTVNRPGFTFAVSPNYEQSGTLLVEAGTLDLGSAAVDFKSGSVTVQTGATLEISTGGSPTHTISGPTTFSGDGVVDNREYFEAQAAVTLSVGSGDPATGVGGFLHRGLFGLTDDVTNTGRFRFLNGGIYDSGDGRFINTESSWAYTGSSGSAAIDGYFLNEGNFQLGGGPMSIDDIFDNQNLFRIVGGYISGLGSFFNYGEFRLEMSDPSATSTVNPRFWPGDLSANHGTVHAVSGHLRFNGIVTFLSAGDLTEGTWIADPGASIRFPETVTRVSGRAVLIGNKSSFPNVDLATVADRGEVTAPEWATIGDLFLDGGTLNVESGGTGVQIDGKLTNGSGGKINVAPGAQLDADQLDNGEDGSESIIPELAPMTVIAKAVVPPRIVTPLLNNHGRILPGGRGDIGTMHLVGNLVQHIAGELDVDLGPDVGEGMQDQLTVDGNATLSGSINVRLAPGFWPTASQEFTILTATGTIGGAITTIIQPAGATFSLRHELNRVVLIADEVTGPSDVPDGAKQFHLAAAYPNPFNPATTISFDLPQEAAVDLHVFDVAGRLVRVLAQGKHWTAGRVEMKWDGRDDLGGLAPAGVYFYRLKAGEFVATRRMTLVK